MKIWSKMAHNVLRLGTVATDYFHFYLFLRSPLCLGAVIGRFIIQGIYG